MPENYFMFADLSFETKHDQYLDKIAHADEYEADAYAAMLKRDQESDNQD